MTATEAAAQWWADTLRAAPKRDAGDEMLNAFGRAVAPTDPVPEDIIVRFEGAVRDELAAQAERGGTAILATDYGPDHELARACTAAGMTRTHWDRLPWKTVMWVDPEKVVVRCGYRADEVQIFPVPESSR